MGNKKIKPYLEYTNEEGIQFFYVGDYIICKTEDGRRYIGRIVIICRYQESEETEPEDAICLNTSQNKTSYSGEIIKIADIKYICKNPVNDLLGYPHIDEQQDSSNFINMIVGLGYDEKVARDMHDSMKELTALYNIPLSSILSTVIHKIDLNKDGECQDELIKIHNMLIDAMVQVFQTNTNSIRKSLEEAIASQEKEIARHEV